MDDKGTNQLLTELRQQFASDPEDNLEKFYELALTFAKSPLESMTQILPICHNIKGSAQAVGFMPLSDVVHELESTLNKLVEKVPTGIDVKKLDPLLQRLVDELTGYFRQLAAAPEDRPELGKVAMALITEMINFSGAEIEEA